MTTEANGNDPRVSETYREAATEKVPLELDRKILTMAADNVRPRYGLARTWTRPVAWAATIGLSLAFVLEISQLNEVAAPALEADTDAVDVLEERLVEKPAVGRSTDVRQQRQELEKRSDAPAEIVSAPPAAKDPGPAMESVSDDFAATDMNLLHEAEELARSRSGPARVVAADAGIAAFAEKKEQVDYCDSAARLSGATWYACIEDLRANSHDEAADLELEALRLKYPEFQEPDASR